MSEQSKTAQALAYLDKNPKATVYRASKEIGVSMSVIYRAVKNRKRERCPCCGSLLKK